MTLFFRSLIFNIYLYVFTFGLMFFTFPRVLITPSYAKIVYRKWGHIVAWGLKNITHIDIAVRGAEHIPTGAALLACKHQSMLETAILFAILEDMSVVLKKELGNIPLANAFIKGCGHIPIDRKQGKSARNFIVREAKDRYDKGQQVLIFPEGTRSNVNSAPRYRRGIYSIYQTLNCACTPVALNSGLFWGRNSFYRHAGTVIIEFLPKIEAGMVENEFMTELTTRIESTVARLVQEGVAEQTAIRRGSHPKFQ